MDYLCSLLKNILKLSDILEAFFISQKKYSMMKSSYSILDFRHKNNYDNVIIHTVHTFTSDTED